MTKHDYDLFVIGGGSGGVRAARIAANHGAKVAVAEEYRYGGTCVIRGCVPKKLFVYASRFEAEFEDAAGFGWTVGKRTFDWPTLVANKDKEIGRLEKIYASNLEKAGVTVLSERAELTGPHHIHLKKQGKTVTAAHILVATGGSAHKPDIPGAEHGITSNEAFHLERLPESIVVQGGGYIAVEFAGIFNGLGVETTLLYRGAQILRGFDDDMRDSLAEEMRKKGIDVRVNADIASLEKTSSGVRVLLKDGGAITAGAVMFATGRVPNTAGLGLETAGVKTGARGEILVDAASRTNVAHIFAVGDVTDRVNLTPVAIREGHAFADSVFGMRAWTVDHANIPTAVFSDPEIGTVGLSEAAARQAYAAIDIYKARFKPMKYTLSGRDERMLMKLVVDAATQKVLGCHVLGPDGAEIVQMAAIAIKMGATKADFDATVALHPSAAEEFVTMRDKWMPPKAAE
jgi:glutathione reductase (NADPH)